MGNGYRAIGKFYTLGVESKKIKRTTTRVYMQSYQVDVSQGGSFDQSKFINHFNALVDAYNAAIGKEHLFKLSPKGQCSGFSLVYAHFAKDGPIGRRLFFSFIKFITYLSENEIKQLAKQIQTSSSERNIYVNFGSQDTQIFTFKDLLNISELISKSQEHQNPYRYSRTIGADWDKSRGIVCKRSELAKNLEAMHIGKLEFIHTTQHAICLERTEDGFYVYDPNSKDMPLLLTHLADVAQSIVDTITRYYPIPPPPDDPYLSLFLHQVSHHDPKNEDFKNLIELFKNELSQSDLEIQKLFDSVNALIELHNRQNPETLIEQTDSIETLFSRP